MRLPWLLPLLACACSTGLPAGQQPAAPGTRSTCQGKEELAPGRALVEFHAQIALPDPPEGLPEGQRSALLPGLVLGGVPVLLVRPIYDGLDGQRPILLFDTGAPDEAVTRRHLA